MDDSGVERMLVDHATHNLHGRSGDIAKGDATHSGVATAALEFSECTITVTSFSQPSTDGRSAECDGRFARLLPVAWPFLTMWAGRHDLGRRMESLEAALDRLEVPTLLIDASAGVRFANQAGQSLLRSDRGVSAGRGMLAGPSLAQTLRLRAAIEHLCSDDTLDTAITPVLAIPRKALRPLMITLDLLNVPADGVDDKRVVARLFDPEDDLAALITPACDFYRLTRTEARLTRALTEGLSVADAAGTMKIQEQTARSYLKQIFLKTETKRQAELVAVMLRSAVRVRPECRAQVF